MIIDAMTIFGIWPRKNADISLEKLLSTMERYSVDKACTLSARGLFYDFSSGNDETIRVCSTEKKLIPVATMNPAAYIGCYDEVNKRIEQGFKMFRFDPTLQEWKISGLVFGKLLRLIEKSEAVIMLPATEGIVNIAKILGGMKNPVIMTSFRYCELGEAIEAMKTYKNIYVETHIINSPDFLEVLKHESLLDRVIYGSNSPLSYMSGAILPVEKSGISGDEKKAVLGGNLARILGGGDLL